MQNQQGDVKLFQTDNEGDINVRDGLVQMGGGLETAAYLSLFGGNEDDDGLAENNKTWWGNLDEIDPARQYRSETQNLLRAIPATSGNLRRIEDATARDLAWFIAERVASSVSVSASIPGVNRIKLTVDIEADGDESRFEFVENWKANV
jgi:phage gp46-like protein